MPDQEEGRLRPRIGEESRSKSEQESLARSVETVTERVPAAPGETAGNDALVLQGEEISIPVSRERDYRKPSPVNVGPLAVETVMRSSVRASGAAAYQIA